METVRSQRVSGDPVQDGAYVIGIHRTGDADSSNLDDNLKTSADKAFLLAAARNVARLVICPPLICPKSDCLRNCDKL